MKQEDKKILIISIVMIAFLSTVSYWRWAAFKVPETYFPTMDLEVPKMEEIMPDNYYDITPERYYEMVPEEYREMLPGEQAEEKSATNEPYYDETISVYRTIEIEEKLIFEYPVGWEVVKTDKEDFKDRSAEFLFLAYSKELIYPSSVTALKIEAQDIDKVIKIIKEITKTEGLYMEITEKEDKEKEHSIKTRNTYGNFVSISKKRIFPLNGYYYVFSVTAFEERWERQLTIIDHILSSVEIN